jgi:hypothetical protein
VTDALSRTWILDSSTFINFLAIRRTMLLVQLRSPLQFPEYVFRVELGLNAREETRGEAEAAVRAGAVGIQRLSIDDLDRMARLEAPRRIGLGEIACAIIAERLHAGVLCDDWKARRWLSERIAVPGWEATEEILLEAAFQLVVSEYDLVSLEASLATGRYQCRFDLRLEFLRRRLTRGLS